MTKAEQTKFFRAIVLKYNRRITAGIAFLDKEFGRKKWLSKIDERVLRLASSSMCVTGQLYTGHWDGFLKKMLKKKGAKPYDLAVKFGFYIENVNEEREGGYDILTRLWFSRISELRILAGMGVLQPPPSTEQ